MFKTKTTLADLQKKSESAKATFTKTVSELVIHNNAIAMEQSNREEIIMDAQNEHNQLQALYDSNQKLILKIQDFLNA